MTGPSRAATLWTARMTLVSDAIFLEINGLRELL
jgi:hypothetical protein